MVGTARCFENKMDRICWQSRHGGEGMDYAKVSGFCNYRATGLSPITQRSGLGY